MPLGELGIPLRWAFKEPGRLSGTNTYVIVEGSLALRNHLAVRETLRADPGLREQYAAVKRRPAPRPRTSTSTAAKRTRQCSGSSPPPG